MKQYSKYITTFLFLLVAVASFHCAVAQDQDEKGYRFLRRIRGLKLVNSEIQELMMDETNNRIVVSYGYKRLTYISIFQMYSWDKMNEYKFNSRVELYNSYFAEDGNVLYANVDLFKLIFLKIDLRTGQIDTLKCSQTPMGCNKVDQQMYTVRATTKDKMYILRKDEEHPNDLQVYFEMYAYKKIKDELSKEPGKESVCVIDVRNKIENDARQKYGIVKPVPENTAPMNKNGSDELQTKEQNGGLSTETLTNEQVQDMLKKGYVIIDGKLYKLDNDAKQTLQNAR